MKILNQKTETVSVDKLKTHPDNPRRGDVDVIVESIDINGFYGAVVAQKSTGYILAGNHRYLAAVRSGAKKIPVIWVDCDDEHARRIMLADNRTSDIATYDTESLAELLKDLHESERGLIGTGYKEEDFSKIINDIEASENKSIDQSSDIKDYFGIIVDCENESEQSKLLARFTKEGLECRALIS